MLRILVSRPNIIVDRLNKSSAGAKPNKKSAKLKSRKSSKFKNLSNSKTIKKTKFLTCKTKETFNYLK